MVSFRFFPAPRHADFPGIGPGQPDARKLLSGAFRVIALFTVFSQVQPGGLDFGRDTYSHNGFHDESDNCGANHSQHEG
jgi:hypothetical protein